MELLEKADRRDANFRPIAGQTDDLKPMHSHKRTFEYTVVVKLSTNFLASDANH